MSQNKVLLCFLLIMPSWAGAVHAEKSQHKLRDCGVVAAAVFIRIHGGSATIEALRAKSEIGKRGMSLDSVKNLINAHGVRAAAYKGDVSSLPELAAVIVDYPVGHFCVAHVDKKHDRIYLIDPPRQNRWVKTGDFEKRWGRHLIALETTVTPGVDVAQTDQ